MKRALFSIGVVGAFGALVLAAAHPRAGDPPVHALPPVEAVGIRIDTLLFGGYAAGALEAAVGRIAVDLEPADRMLVGQHLDRIFGRVLPASGLGRTGRLRVAYERAVRPDGSTRAVRVLGAEVAVAGRLHTAYYFEAGEGPGYFDPFGEPLEREGWEGPLRTLRVTSAFGDRRIHPILQRVLPHAGVDLAAAAGEPVLATADGVVTIAQDRGGYGLLVEIRHANGFSTRYAHLSRLAPGVAPGVASRRGEVVGYVGSSGLATAPHLHYEVRSRGRAVDPLRVAGGETGLGFGLTTDPRWPAERRQVAALLARAPSLLPARTATRPPGP